MQRYKIKCLLLHNNTSVNFYRSIVIKQLRHLVGSLSSTKAVMLSVGTPLKKSFFLVYLSLQML